MFGFTKKELILNRLLDGVTASSFERTPDGRLADKDSAMKSAANMMGNILRSPHIFGNALPIFKNGDPPLAWPIALNRNAWDDRETKKRLTMHIYGIRTKHPDGGWIWLTAPNGSGLTDRPEMAWGTTAQSDVAMRAAWLQEAAEHGEVFEAAIIP